VVWCELCMLMILWILSVFFFICIVYSAVFLEFGVFVVFFCDVIIVISLAAK